MSKSTTTTTTTTTTCQECEAHREEYLATPNSHEDWLPYILCKPCMDKENEMLDKEFQAEHRMSERQRIADMDRGHINGAY